MPSAVYAVHICSRSVWTCAVTILITPCRAKAAVWAFSAPASAWSDPLSRTGTSSPSIRTERALCIVSAALRVTRLRQHGLQVLTLQDEPSLAELQRIIHDELSQNRVLPASRAWLLAAVRRLHADGAVVCFLFRFVHLAAATPGCSSWVHGAPAASVAGGRGPRPALGVGACRRVRGCSVKKY